jgi:hypothetical protein
MNDNSILRRALKRMGFEVVAENTQVSQYGSTEKVELLLDKGNNGTGALGLSKQEDGTYSIVGDPYHCTNSKLRAFYGKQNDLSKKLGTAYAVEKVSARCEELGFSCEENSEATIGADGTIQMVFTSYAM